MMGLSLPSRTAIACPARENITDSRTSPACRITRNSSMFSVTENSYGEFSGRSALRVLTSSSTCIRRVWKTFGREHGVRSVTQSYSRGSLGASFAALSVLLSPQFTSGISFALQEYCALRQEYVHV